MFQSRSKLFAISLTSILLSLPLSSFAGNDEQEESKISNMDKVDKIYLSHKRDLASDLAFSKLNKIIRGDKRDISTIQAMLDEEVVSEANDEELLALGVLLGDVYVKEDQLEWKNYTDDLGKSRAVCLPRTEQCLFPITMISKRIKRGVKPNVNEMYTHGLSLIEEYFPKVPYTADK